MKQYTVTGMSCAACSTRVEKAVLSVDGVTSCSVSLLTNSMGVEGSASPKAIIAAVEKAGYGAQVKGNSDKKPPQDSLEDKETPILKKRLFSSLVFLVVLMYVSMGHTMWDWPLPSFFDGNYIAIALLQMLLALSVMVINQKFFTNGFKGIIKRAPNMDTLVALGSGASFIYSTYVLFAMTASYTNGDFESAMNFSHELYFESAAMIVALITVGKMLEAHSKGKTTNALKTLMDLAPKTAVVIINGKESEIPASDVKKGDIFVVRPGFAIPVDGIIIEGHCAVNEAALTGESIPVDKSEGDTVFAPTVNQSGYIRCKATKVGEDTTLSQIIKMVSDAAATKAPISKISDKVSGFFVPVVIAIAVITAAFWYVSGESLGFALARGISVLVISCPCALGLATPVAIMVGNGVGAKNGILFKTASSLEEGGKIDVIALDKTGTITKGEPEVTDIILQSGTDENELLKTAYSLEIKSEHPLAKAIVRKAQELNTEPYNSTDFKVLPGNGLCGVINGKSVFGGNYKFISQKATVPPEAEANAEQLANQGKTPLFFAQDSKFIGIIAVADAVKEDSAQAIKELKNMGIHVVMLTGDNSRTANAVKELVGVDEAISDVLPDGKENVIRSLKEHGKVAMVGDGINDAPALTSADIGIAIGAGTDVAIDAADVVLVNSRLSDVPAAIRLSRATLKNIHENLFWAFIYNIIGIPLAAGAWIPLFGWELNPMFGAAAMSLSSFCVVTNALRLNWFDIRSTAKDRKIRKKEDRNMKKTLKIEGMMCGHCEARVKKCLEAVDGVTEAVVSHKEGTAIVKLSKDVPYELLKETVESQDYKVID